MSTQRIRILYISLDDVTGGGIGWITPRSLSFYH